MSEEKTISEQDLEKVAGGYVRPTPAARPDRNCPVCYSQLEGVESQNYSCPACGRRFRMTGDGLVEVND